MTDAQTSALPLAAPAQTNLGTSPDVAPPTGLSRSSERYRRHRRTRNWGKVVVLSVFAIAALVLLLVAWRWFDNPRDGHPAVGSSVEFPSLKCRYLKPNSPWETDPAGIKFSLKALLVMRRTAPHAWLALMAKDYNGQTLRDGDIREEAIRRMGGYFHKESLEWKQGEEAQLAGRRAQRLVFRGDAGNTPMSGECFCLAHQGIAYWFLTWAPADRVAAAQEEFEDLRRRFALLDDPKDRTEKPPAAQSFRGHELPYTLQDSEHLWEEWTPAADFDRNADLALVARERTERQKSKGPKAPVAATVVVLFLKERQENLEAAVIAARDYVEAQQKVAYPETAIETVAEKAQVPEPDERLGSVPSQVLLLHVINGETRHRFMLLHVTRLQDQVLILQCESAWPSRAKWEPPFRQLLGTLQLAGQKSEVRSQRSEVRDQSEGSLRAHF